MHPRRVAAHGAAWIVFFTAAVLAGALAHLGHPVARRLVAVAVNRTLAPVLAGRVTVDRVGALSATHVGELDAHVDGADGTPVLRLQGVHAHISTWVLLRRLLAPRSRVVLDIRSLSIARVDIALDADAAGVPRLARAFALRDASTAPSSSKASVRLDVRDIRIGEVTFHASPSAPVSGTVEGLGASLRVAGDRLSLEVGEGRLSVAGLPGGVMVAGDLEGGIATSPLRAHARWRGGVGPIAETAEVTYADGRVDAVVEVARASPEQLQGVWSACPLAGDVAARLEAHGKIPHLDLTAHLDVGSTGVDVRGPVDVGAAEVAGPATAADASIRAALHVEASSIDLRAFAARAPASHLGASGDLWISARPEGAFAARASIAVRPGEIGAVRIPGVALTAAAAIPPAGLPTLDAEMVAREPGAPSALTVHVAPKGGAAFVTFEAQTNATRLDQVTRFGAFASGSATVRSTGSIDTGTGLVSAEVSASVDGLAVRGFSLAFGRVNARIQGAFPAPSIDVDVGGEGLEVGPTRLEAVHAAGRVVSGAGTTVRNVELTAEGEGIEARATAAVVRLGADGFGLDDALVHGFGEPLTASLHLSPGGVDIRAKSAGLDLVKVARLAALPVSGGTARVDVDGAVAAGSADGHVAIDVAHASIYGLRDASASLDATVHGRRASGSAALTVEDVGSIQVHSASLDVAPGPLLSASPWRKTWGALDFTGHVNLAKLAARLPASLVPFDETFGTLEVTGRVERDDASDDTPSVDASARTTGLEFAQTARTLHPLHVAGIDPLVNVTVDGKTGHTTLRVDLAGPARQNARLVHFEASSSDVPYAALFSDADPAAALRAMIFDASLDVPGRSFADFPAPFRPQGVGGTFEAHAKWRGSLESPSVDLAATIQKASEPNLLLLPVDLDAEAHYDGGGLDAHLEARAKNARVVDATAHVALRAADLLGGHGVPWEASARAKFDRLSLRTVGVLYDRQVRGTLSGDVTLDGLGRDARARADLTLDGLQIHGVALRSGTLRFSADGHAIDGDVHLAQSDGAAEARLHVGARWGASIAPSVDPAQPALASFAAKNFRAAFVLPFAPSSLTELDGRMDAEVHADLDPAARIFRPRGTIELRDGVFELATFGTEFHSVSAKLAMTPDGVVRLDPFTARGLTGAVRAAATARIDTSGLVGARIEVLLPERDPLPLVFDGVAMGALEGRFAVAVERASPGYYVTVDVPAAHLELPSGSTSRDAQALGDVPGVQIGVRTAREFVTLALDHSTEDPAGREAARKSPIHVAIKLGGGVRVQRGGDLDVHLQGQPVVALTDETRVSGQIRFLPGGTLDVQGRVFEIENGAITFVGDDATNPQVVLTAGWTAPDGTRIFADYAGPLKAAKVTLRSSPYRPANEIDALLLTGSTEDAVLQESGGNNGNGSFVASAAGKAAGSAATAELNQALVGVNRALDKLGLGKGISTKIDTSQACPRPEVEVKIARDISLQVAWVLGAPPPTQPDSTLVTLDWRFLRQWSLETTVGDAGTSILNLIWQHRY
jgi:translocation and assembly module TamB